MNGQWLTKLNVLGITLCESNSSHLKMDGWNTLNTSQSDHFRYQAPTTPKKNLPKLATGGDLVAIFGGFSTTYISFFQFTIRIIIYIYTYIYIFIVYIYIHIFFLKWCVSCKAFDVFFAKIPPPLFRHQHVFLENYHMFFFPSCASHVGIHPSIHPSIHPPGTRRC